MLGQHGKLRGQGRSGLGHGNEATLLEVFGHFEDRLHHDAPAIERPSRQHIAIIRFEGTGDFKAAGAFGGEEVPLEFLGARKAQVQAFVPVADQRRAIGGHAAAGDIGRGSAEDAGAIGDEPDLEGGILKQAKVEGDVEPFGGDVDHPVRQAQAQVDLRIEILEGGHMGRNETPPDAQGGSDEDGAARVLGHVHDGGLGLVYRFQHLARAVIEDAAVLGGLQAARRAVEEADAQMLFQFRDTGRGDSGRAALIACRRTHAAQFVDTHEHSDVVHIGHGGPSPFFAPV